MIVLVFLLSIAATLSFLAWAYILFLIRRGRGIFNPSPKRFVPLSEWPAVSNWPPVCVLVPARNEAQSLPNTLPALLSQRLSPAS